MELHPSGTVFAVLAKGTIDKGDREYIHWLNAYRSDDGVSYIDFQPNRDSQTTARGKKLESYPDSSAPHIKAMPFIGIVEQNKKLVNKTLMPLALSELEQKEEEGVFDEDVRLRIISFAKMELPIKVLSARM